MWRSIKIKLSIYGELIKYKLSLAVAVSAATGYVLCKNSPDPGILTLFAAIFLMASGSAALNQYTERNVDSIMERTRGRPLPSRKISPLTAKIVFILLLTTGSLLLLFSGFIPFTLGLLNIILYNLIYTSLKKKTSFSIIPGALVGAIPPIIGFTSAGGTVLNMKILLFSTFMFLWQIPHFWLLIIRYGKDYRDAGFITISNYLNEKQIKNITFWWILLTSLVLIFFSGLSNTFSRYFFYIVFILNPFFIFFFYKLLFSHKKLYSLKGAFIILNVFSILVMCLLVADSFLSGI
jgi:protoheme IX farnesyltransferase